MRSRRALLAAVAVSATLRVPGLSAEPEPRPLEVDALLRAPRLALFTPPTVSPDGRFAAFTVIDPARIPPRVDQAEVGYRTGVPWSSFGGDIERTIAWFGEHLNPEKGDEKP